MVWNNSTLAKNNAHSLVLFFFYFVPSSPSLNQVVVKVRTGLRAGENTFRGAIASLVHYLHICFFYFSQGSADNSSPGKDRQPSEHPCGTWSRTAAALLLHWNAITPFTPPKVRHNKWNRVGDLFLLIKTKHSPLSPMCTLHGPACRSGGVHEREIYLCQRMMLFSFMEIKACVKWAGSLQRGSHYAQIANWHDLLCKLATTGLKKGSSGRFVLHVGVFKCWRELGTVAVFPLAVFPNQ